MPRGVELARQDSLVVSQHGPGGQAVYDLARVLVPQGSVPVLVAYRAPLVPALVPQLRRRLLELDEDLRLRASAGRGLPVPRIPMIVTDSASAGVISACEREDVALVDLRGTLLLRSEGIFVRVVGQTPVQRRSRAPVFHGKGCRLVRTLLTAPEQIRTARELSEQAQTSYAYTHGVLTQLEQDGYLVRASRNTGFRVRDAVGLLRAWVESGEKTAVAAEGFHAPSTMPETLRSGYKALEEQGIHCIFTLASGLLPEERFVSGLPHGLYLTGSIEPVVQALELRRLTPHNFWVLRPEVAAETGVGGVYSSPRALPHGPGVSLPQLAVDFQHSGGRGKEQAEALVERFARDLPL
ncbi:hypothetical protein POL68_26140 [Stigmatella sp. ncwal1]|uniref:HTH iclR-type domain-containing protein n=1 Tax=Stigmatella ashevillensis TaxID=2995309 RepID=A0ABT5DE66_9BACT|nr:hypothetical protein [Stigmatella ashevillena]MDC0711975.1 hypothetical protein [Stigmatella ashevillena]